MPLKALVFLSSLVFSLGVNAGLTEREKDVFVYDLSLATQGIMVSQFNTGVNYSLGIGIHKDIEKGVYWYQEASNQGHSKAPFNLSLIFAGGKEGPKDLMLSKSYLDLAVKRGNEEAKELFKKLISLENEGYDTLTALENICCPPPILHQQVFELKD
ncbi:MAG: tetratricopeptide repeat protein [Gammaproteobacteria bacterium]